MNKKLLFEDISFPLKWDSQAYKMYIFDADNNMIAQVDTDFDATKFKHPFEKLIGDYKEPRVNYELFKLEQGEFYEVFNPDQYIGQVRGWGGLQYKDHPEERQDNIAKYILSIINS